MILNKNYPLYGVELLHFVCLYADLVLTWGISKKEGKRKGDVLHLLTWVTRILILEISAFYICDIAFDTIIYSSPCEWYMADKDVLWNTATNYAKEKTVKNKDK